MEGGKHPTEHRNCVLGCRWLETKEAPRALHGTCGSFLLFSCGDRPVGDMLLQSKHRTHSGRKQCSGGRKESENLPSNLTSRVWTDLSVHSLCLRTPQAAKEEKGVR